MSFRRSQTVPQVISAIVLLLGLWIIYFHRAVPANDLTEYWSSAHLLLARQNPYSPHILGEMEKQLGRHAPQPLIMLNPPWIFPAILPLGLVSYATASLFWLWLNLLAILFSVRTLWRLYGGPERIPAFVWLLIGLFLPFYVQLAIGQVGGLVLLGITGFLYAQRKRMDVLAGLALYLVVLKPHIAFLLWIVGTLWVLQERRWRIAYSFVGTMIGVCLIPLAFDPSVYQHYGLVWKYGRIIWSGTPTLGGVLCLALVSKGWIAFIPFDIAVVWGILYWRNHRNNWDWLNRAPLLLLVSVAASPYAWFFDQVILVPAIIQIVTSARTLPFLQWRVSLLIYAGINIGIVLSTGTNALPLFGPWFAWIAPTWLLLYLGYCWQNGRVALATAQAAARD